MPASLAIQVIHSGKSARAIRGYAVGAPPALVPQRLVSEPPPPLEVFQPGLRFFASVRSSFPLLLVCLWPRLWVHTKYRVRGHFLSRVWPVPPLGVVSVVVQGLWV